MQVLHAYSLTQADGTATSVVRPTDWNSVHNLAYNLSGNTAGSSQVSGTNVVLVGANGVTLSADTANSRLAFSVANQTQQPMAFSAGGASTTANTIQFANSNGLSFGLTNGSISASYTVPTQSAQPVAVSGSNGSFAFSTLSMGNSNGLTFYTTNGSIVGSYTVPAAQTTQTQPAGNIVGAGYTSTTQAGSTVGLTQNSNGLSAAWPPFLTTSPAQTVQPVAASGSNGSFVFSTLSMGASNGLTFYTTNGSVVGSYTVPTVGAGATATGNFGAIVGGTQTATSGTVNFANGNGITFGMSGSSQITASHNGITLQTVQPVAVSGSNGSFAFSTLSLGDSNGLNFYTTNGSIVGSYTVPTQSAQPVAVSGSNGSFAFSTLSLGNLNGVSFYTSNGSVVASYTVPTQSAQPVAYSAANGSAAFSTLTFANSNGVSFSSGTQGLFATVRTDYQSAGAYLTTARASNDAIGLNTALTGNGVAWTVNSSGISLNVPAFLTTAALSNHSHGNPTLALTNLSGTTASASNGLTLSISAAAQSVQPVAYSAANGSAAFSTLTFANSNGVSFSSGTQGLFATVRTDYQSAGAYLTTARASNDAVGLNTALTGNGVAWTVNSSGISLNVPAFLTTAALSDHSHGNPTLALTNLSGTTASNSAGFTLSLSAAAGGGGADGYNILAAGTQTANTTGTVAFVNSNGITFGMSNNSQITASHNGITQQSTQPVAVSGSNGSFAFSTLSMGNSNGLLFYTTNGSIVGSYTVPTQSVQPVAYSAANGSAAFSTLTFANSNGVSFSSGTQGLFATVRTDYQSAGAYLTTARASNDAVGLNSALTAGPVAVTMNSSGLSLNFGSVAGTSTGFTGGASIGGSMTHNTAGLALSLSHPAWITTARASNDAVGLNTALTGNGVAWTVNSSGISLNVPTFLTTAALSNHSHGNPTLALTNINGTTASASNGLTLSLSAVVPAQTNQTGNFYVSGNTTQLSSTAGIDLRSISFEGAGIASVGVSNGRVLVSVPAGGGGGDGYNILMMGSSGNTTGTAWSSSAATVSLYGAGAATVSQNNSNQIQISVPSVTSLYAGANITLSSNGNSVSIIGPAGAGAPDRHFKEIIPGERLTTIVGLSATNVTNRPIFMPFWMEGTGMAANTARILMSVGGSSNRSLGGTFRVGLYSLNNSTQMTLLTSNSFSVSITASSQSSAWNGAAWVDFGLGGYTMSAEGRYMLALQVNPVSANVTWMPVSLYGADPMPVQSRIITNGTTQALSSNSQFVPFWGAYSTTSASLPNSVGITQINGASSQFQFQFYAALREV